MEMLINVAKILGLVVLILFSLIVIYGMIAGTIETIRKNRIKKQFQKEILPKAEQLLKEIVKEEKEKKDKPKKTTKKTTKTTKKDSK